VLGACTSLGHRSSRNSSSAAFHSLETRTPLLQLCGNLISWYTFVHCVDDIPQGMLSLAYISPCLRCFGKASKSHRDVSVFMYIRHRSALQDLPRSECSMVHVEISWGKFIELSADDSHSDFFRGFLTLLPAVKLSILRKKGWWLK
jgi:hypothetical protein